MGDKLNLGARDLIFPTLEFIKDGKEYHINSIEVPLAEKLELSENEISETISSGQKRFLHRLGWVKWFLKKGELITILSQAKFKINSTGIRFLKENPNFTWNEFEKLPGWINEVKRYKEKYQKKSNTEIDTEQIDVKSELLDKIKEISPYFFESLLVQLLEKMGYGIGIVTQKSHDDGIDGIVTADKLGLSEIYIQAKRYSNSVPISHIKEFIGTIQTTKTKTGVFITSGTLPTSANEVIIKSGLNIQLIDGKKLSDLMYEFDIGLKTKTVEPVKYIDEGFFIEKELG